MGTDQEAQPARAELLDEAVGYSRISSDRDGEEAGVERQDGDITALAERRAARLRRIFTDNDISALLGAPRPGYEALLAEVRAGRVKIIIVWQTSRLWRNRRERAEAIELFAKHAVRVLAVKGPELDFTTAYGRAMAGLLGEFDTMESEVKSERIIAQKAAAARAGAFLGGVRPFGYTADGMELVPDEAKLIEDAYHTLLRGGSLGSIIRGWNEKGVKTTRAGQPRKNGKAITGEWTRSGMRYLLLRARNAGLYEFNGEILGAAPWPAIVPENIYRAVCALIRNPERRKSRDMRAKWLLGGVGTCAVCGAIVLRQSGRDTIWFYRCSRGGKGHAYQRAIEADRTVATMTVAYLSESDVRQAIQRLNSATVDVDALDIEVKAERAILADLEAMFAKRDKSGRRMMSAAGYEANRADVLARLERVEEQLRQATGDELLAEVVSADDVRALWDGMDIERRRALLRRVWGRIVVLPGIRAWKDGVPPGMAEALESGEPFVVTRAGVLLQEAPGLPNHAAELAAQLAPAKS